MTTTMSKTNSVVLWAKQQLCTCIMLFDVHCTTATWNLQMQRSMGMWTYIFLNLDKDLKSSTPVKSPKLKTTQIHFSDAFYCRRRRCKSPLYLLQSELCVVVYGFIPSSIRKRYCNLHYLVSFLSISFDNQISCMLSRQALGTLSNDDDDSSENITKKMNLRSFKLYSVYW